MSDCFHHTVNNTDAIKIQQNYPLPFLCGCVDTFTSVWAQVKVVFVMDGPKGTEHTVEKVSFFDRFQCTHMHKT